MNIALGLAAVIAFIFIVLKIGRWSRTTGTIRWVLNIYLPLRFANGYNPEMSAEAVLSERFRGDQFRAVSGNMSLDPGFN